MEGILKWGDSQEEEKVIASRDELEKAIQELFKQAVDESYPFTVEFSVDNDSFLMLIVGLPFSIVNHFSRKRNPRLKGALYDWGDSGNDWIVYYYRTHYSEMEKKYFVPFDMALEALYEYFETGKCPVNINLTS